MPVAQEMDQVAPGIFVWQFYDPKVKADLFSTLLETPSGTYLIDPIPLGTEAMKILKSPGRVNGVVVTNENHERAAGQFAEKFSVPIFLHASLGKTMALPGMIELPGDGAVSPGLTAHAIDGAPLGELALHYDADGGTVIVGDALINFEPQGFALLPTKYCRDFKLMRRSLHKLLECTFERLLFAHGTPILSGARGRLEQLLAASR